ncbi:hypothetical protein N9878_01180 [bacterium]|nr:hypothetical protein [bacterium]
MNRQSATAIKLKDIDKSSAEVSFLLFPQNVNEAGFLQRFVNEQVEITPAWQDRDGKIVDSDDGSAILGAKFQVKLTTKEPAKTTKKPVKDSE